MFPLIHVFTYDVYVCNRFLLNYTSLKGKGVIVTLFLSKNTLYKNIEVEIGWEIKNILRIYKAGLAGNVKNTEPRPKFPYSYKKKSVYILHAQYVYREKVNKRNDLR